MSTKLVSAASRFLDARTSRRGFLRRAAMVGTALVAAPATYLLRPVTAEAAIVPSQCGSRTRCNDGWTDFCANIYGVNTCPPGALVGGWWRATGNTHCGGGNRYYMDCHDEACSCGCGSSGTCSATCTDFPCHCSHDNCNERKTACTRFRYGQCNNQEPCIGAIICRVVTCIPPWEWDSSCRTTDAISQSTYSHDAPGLHPDITPKGPYPARLAVITGTTWELRNSLTSGGANSTFQYGLDDDFPIMADFSNSGVRTAGMVRGTRHGLEGNNDQLVWYIRQVEGPGDPALVVAYGRAGDIPVVGDWNGTGVHTMGVVRGNRWLLRNANRNGTPSYDFTFGQPGDIPVVGDWNGNGRTGIGVVRGNRWLLRNSPSSGAPDYDFTFGSGNGYPVTGDWNGNGSTGIGWFDAGTWQIRHSPSSGGSDSTFTFGNPNGRPATWGRNA
ncbi:MAG: twin-arginine translocation signal domain-containing protein [Acidimicrobiia bacterium]